MNKCNQLNGFFSGVKNREYCSASEKKEIALNGKNREIICYWQNFFAFVLSSTSCKINELLIFEKKLLSFEGTFNKNNKEL